MHATERIMRLEGISMRLIQFATAAALFTTTACSVTEPPRYGADHPANAAAPTTPTERVPGALSTYRTFDEPAARSQQEDDHGHRH
jgi:hypothetical protein